MKNTNCKHCQLNCKQIGKTECEKYNAKANRPEQLKAEIKLAYSNSDNATALKLQNELDMFYYGQDKTNA